MCQHRNALQDASSCTRTRALRTCMCSGNQSVYRNTDADMPACSDINMWPWLAIPKARAAQPNCTVLLTFMPSKRACIHIVKGERAQQHNTRPSAAPRDMCPTDRDVGVGCHPQPPGVTCMQPAQALASAQAKAILKCCHWQGGNAVCTGETHLLCLQAETCAMAWCESSRKQLPTGFVNEPAW